MNAKVWISPCLNGIAMRCLGLCVHAILKCKFIATLQGFACNEGTKHCLLVLQVLY